MHMCNVHSFHSTNHCSNCMVGVVRMEAQKSQYECALTMDKQKYDTLHMILVHYMIPIPPLVYSVGNSGRRRGAS